MALIERSFREKIILVGVILPGRQEDDVEAHLDELAQLIDTAGANVVARAVQRRREPDPATYIGKGKAEELHELSLAVYPGSVLFSAETGEGVDELLQTLSDRLRALADVVELLVPFDRGDVVAALHREGEVLLESHEDEGTRIRGRLDEAGASRFREFAVSASA